MLVSEAVQYAYREANLVPINSTLTAAELAEGIYRLNALWEGFKSGDIGELLNDWNLPTVQRTANTNTDFMNLDYSDNLTTFDQPGTSGGYGQNIGNWPAQNSRIVCRITEAATLWFPQFPSDGAQMGYADNGASATLTIDANGRKIEGAQTITLVAGSEPRSWFYRADRAEWMLQEEMIATSDLPLPREFNDLFVCGLAIRLCALDTLKPQDSTIQAYTIILKLAKTRYRQRGQQSYGGQNIPNTIQSYDSSYFGGNRW